MKYHLLIITAAALLAACQNTAPQQEAAEKAQTGEKKELSVTVSDEQMLTINLQTAHLEEREMGGTVRVNGVLKLYPQDRADVGCLIGGVVHRILVKPGQQVRAGQTLAYIENTEILNLQREYADAVRNATLAHQELERQQALAQEGAAVGRNLQQAAADAKNAAAQRKALKLQLQQLHISAAAVEAGNFVRQVPVTSPINGIIGEIAVNTGTYAEPQTVIMRVQNNRALYADLNVYEKDVDRVAVGQEVNILLTNHATHDVKAKVVRITPSLDKTMKTMSVQAQIIDAEHCTNMVADMAVSAEIIIGKHRALAIPEEAVVEIKGKKYLFVHSDAEDASIHDHEAEKTATHKEADNHDEAAQGHADSGKDHDDHAEGHGSHRHQHKETFFRCYEVETGVTDEGYIEVRPLKPIPEGASIVTGGSFYLASMLNEHGDHNH